MDWTSIAVVVVGYFTAGLVKGTTGLGFSSTCLPILTLAVGLKDALPLVLIPSVISNILVMIDAGGFWPTVKRFWPLFLAQLPGVVLGLYLLDRVESEIAAAALGLVLIGYALLALTRPALAVPDHLERPLYVPTGILTGLVNGLTGSQVMPVLPYMMALGLIPALFIQAINISFTLSSAVMFAGLAKLGLFTLTTLWISTAGLGPVFAGTWLGGRVRRWLAPEAFRRVVLLCLPVLGLILIGKPFLV